MRHECPLCGPCCRWRNVCLSLLESKPNAQSAVDATNNFALPLENSRIATKEVAKAASGHRVNNGAKEANKSKYHSENGKLCNYETSFWGNKLRQEREEEQSGFRVQHLSEDRLSERLGCGDRNATLTKIDGCLFQYRLQP